MMLKLIIIIMYLTLAPVLIIHSELESDFLKSFKKCQRSLFPLIEGNYSRSQSQRFKSTMEVQKEEWQIVNGTLVDISDFPYISCMGYCNLEDKKFSFCGGSIITDYHILTSAQCTTEFKTFTAVEQVAEPLYKVREKEYFIIHIGSSYLTEGGQFLKVSEIHVHPEYNTEGFYGRDLAVLKAAEKFPISNTVATIPLATSELSHQLEVMENSQTECVIAGWGLTMNPKKFPLSLPTPILLRSVKLSLMKLEHCIKIGRKMEVYITRKEHFCTYERYKSLCIGDNGGGFVCRSDDGVRRVWGVYSNGKLCGEGLNPQYYSRVDNADSFLKQFLGTQSSPVQSLATLRGAVLKPLLPLVLQVASFSFK